MTKDIEREVFEAYEHSKKPNAFKSFLFEVFIDSDLDEDEKSYIGKYTDSFMQEKWELWQAAKSDEAEKLKGCVVVPVEPTDSMYVAFEKGRLMSCSVGGFKDFNDGYKELIRAALEKKDD